MRLAPKLASLFAWDRSPTRHSHHGELSAENDEMLPTERSHKPIELLQQEVLHAVTRFNQRLEDIRKLPATAPGYCFVWRDVLGFDGGASFLGTCSACAKTTLGRSQIVFLDNALHPTNRVCHFCSTGFIDPFIEFVALGKQFLLIRHGIS